MIDRPEGILLACIILGLVVLFNVGLMYSLLRSDPNHPIAILGKAARRARSPWQEEDEGLAELRRRVDSLRADEAEGHNEKR